MNNKIDKTHIKLSKLLKNPSDVNWRPSWQDGAVVVGAFLLSKLVKRDEAKKVLKRLSRHTDITM